jgi:hypothetical protein
MRRAKEKILLKSTRYMKTVGAGSAPGGDPRQALPGISCPPGPFPGSFRRFRWHGRGEKNYNKNNTLKIPHLTDC